MQSMPSELTEAEWEAYALEWLGEHGWTHLHGTRIAPGAALDRLERPGWDELILVDRLHAAIERLNPDIPPSAVEDAMAQLRRRESQDPLAENFRSTSCSFAAFGSAMSILTGSSATRRSG
jgi:type I restriction enzyme R subunit